MHSDKTKMFALAAPGRLLGRGEATAVVLNGERHLVGIVVQADVDVRRLGVTNSVVDGFASDLEQLRFDLDDIVGTPARDSNDGSDAITACRSVRQALKRIGEPDGAVLVIRLTSGSSPLACGWANLRARNLSSAEI